MNRKIILIAILAAIVILGCSINMSQKITENELNLRGNWATAWTDKRHGIEMQWSGSINLDETGHFSATGTVFEVQDGRELSYSVSERGNYSLEDGILRRRFTHYMRRSANWSSDEIPPDSVLQILEATPEKIIALTTGGKRLTFSRQR